MNLICKRAIGLGVLAVLTSVRLSAQAPAPRVILVELFTSEGCSSCPPADALLREINGTTTGSGVLIVGISEHVTYWNSLGWADPFSSSLFTERQTAYGERFGLDSVYTPQMVINGTEQIVGSDRTRLVQALTADADKPMPVAVHILSVRIADGGLVVKFSMANGTPALKADVVAVLVDDLDKSSVSRGENSGRNLSHVSVARSLSRSALQATGEQEIRLPLPASFQASQKHHVILFAQAPSHGRVLGVDTSPITQ